ncbi:hypothetical protein M2323_004525 [Rhodoblastus acidophilus]|nr:hypothetical protein [Rhodoblastus acidophilus]MCW2335575.1 hypothetical protein [Rhodoblastus acidophilus]
MIPPLGHNKTTKYYTPWQGIGARGVNNLASKLLLALLPPNSPCFRLQVDSFTLQKIAGNDTVRSQVEDGLGKIERAVTDEIEGTGMRAPIFQTLKHLIIGGNALLYLPPKTGTRVFGLDNYVAVRDPKGNLLEVIIKEVVNADALDNKAIDRLEDMQEGEETKPDKDDEVEVYTRFYRGEDNRWHMYQEVLGEEVPGSRGSWPLEKPPILCLRWTAVEGEDYGRSYVEEYIGDLIALEALSKAMVEAAASASKIIWLVSPNGVTRAKDITESESGDAIVGHKDDVHCLQSEKQADMKIAYEAVKTITERLSYAFLLSSAIQRNGERVTAEEIRYMAGELEDALGGVYSILAQEFQLPLIMRVMDRMQKAKRLPDLPKDVVKPVIVTGLAALGRGHDLNKLQMFMQGLQQFGPQALSYINIPDLITRWGTSLMIDMGGLVKDPQQVQQEQQQMMQQQQLGDIASKAAPNAVKAISDHMMAANQGQQPTQ